MLDGARIAITMPGINVSSTLERTIQALPKDYADTIFLADDGSTDDTVQVAKSLGVRVFSHSKNLGYGAGQKTTYREALKDNADVAVMVHPDFQYKPELVPALAAMVVHGGYDLVLASRMLDGGALRGGMPIWKFAANRFLTGVENAMLGGHVSEYHTGYRAFSKRFLEEMPLAGLSNGFHFDSETIALALLHGYRIGELSCPAHYFDGMQSMPATVGVRYGLGCLRTAVMGAIHRSGLHKPALFTTGGPTLLEAWTEGVEQ
ncbi:MAG: glycosyltransferase family 2 protein [Deltaproteobacteria bacterium]|nr:glycosyltransferase family 2 protein [Deltaproteobacteria bacterium]